MLLDVLFCVIDGFENSAVLADHRFGSFCPTYNNNSVRFYVNGYGPRNYFHDLHDELLRAEKEVFINDWFLSPQLYLKRPVEDFPESRLDFLLTHIASKGVQVFIILYREIEGTLPNNSNYTKRYLNKCHNNIHIVRHPRFFVHYWSHHEKMVVIDGRVVFMGGLDLCYGRYEAKGYPLSEPIKGKTVFKGQDFSNVRIKDFENVHKWDLCLIDKVNQPRMPWRDIALRLTGDAVKGLKKHFLQFWNFNNVQFAYKESIMKNISWFIR